MTIEQAVAALCAHLEAERVSLEQLYYLLEYELEALRDMNRDRINELNQYKLKLLQSHQDLLGARAYYLAPFTPPPVSHPPSPTSATTSPTSSAPIYNLIRRR